MNNKQKLKAYFTTQRIAYLGIMVSLAVLTNVFPIFFNGGNNSISFTYTIYLLAGAFFGPVSGGIVGLLSDLLGFLIAPQGPYIPLITLSSALMGVIGGMIYKIPKVNHYVKLALAYVVIFVICTLGLNTLGLWIVYAQGKKTFWVYLIGRAPIQTLVVAVNIAITYVLYIPLKKYVFDKFQPKKQITKTELSPKTEEKNEDKED